uniref:Uncharacterized protein LOC111105867 n=1 Tax=Crassostrea virginica TaxID=6565 RepID=A0A8B8AY14_CRAVI|nr:uncharacterized protein LOC111105867 [Crassostrea virginica]
MGTYETASSFFAMKEDKEWWNSLFRQYDDRDHYDEWYIKEILSSKTRKFPQDMGDVFDFVDDEDVSYRTPGRPFLLLSLEDFVLGDIPKYAGEWPQVYKILNIDEQVTVRW